MAKFGWDKTLETGDQTLDSQHQELFSLCGDFADAIDAGRGEEAIEATLFEMLRYAAGHFELEERLMALSAYPTRDSHEAAHGAFSERAEQLANEYISGERVSVEDLYSYLLEWLVIHVTYEDRKLVEHVQSAGVDLASLHPLATDAAAHEECEPSSAE